VFKVLRYALIVIFDTVNELSLCLTEKIQQSDNLELYLTHLLSKCIRVILYSTLKKEIQYFTKNVCVTPSPSPRIDRRALIFF